MGSYFDVGPYIHREFAIDNRDSAPDAGPHVVRWEVEGRWTRRFENANSVVRTRILCTVTCMPHPQTCPQHDKELNAAK